MNNDQIFSNKILLKFIRRMLEIKYMKSKNQVSSLLKNYTHDPQSSPVIRTCCVNNQRTFRCSLPDILPQNAEGFPATKEFLMKVVDILIDFIKSTNDRHAKVLDFHHPSEMMRLLDLEIPDTGVTLQQLLIDCSTTLKYQVRTGKFTIAFRLINQPKEF